MPEEGKRARKGKASGQLSQHTKAKWKCMDLPIQVDFTVSYYDTILCWMLETK